jgi:hypothetical protein
MSGVQAESTLIFTMMVTLQFVLICWSLWAFIVISYPATRTSRHAASPLEGALLGAQGPPPAALVDARPQQQPELQTSPTQGVSLPFDYQGQQPCLVASQLVQPQLANDLPNLTPAPLPTIPAQVGWDCIQSVPLNNSAAVALMDSLQPYLQWQSTTAFLKNPPDEYIQKVQGPVDIMGMYQNIREKLASNGYANEYAVSAHGQLVVNVGY